MMYSILAILPVLTALVLMTKCKMAPDRALPVSLVMTAVSGFCFWKMPVLPILSGMLAGSLKSLDIIFTIFGAVLLLNVLKSSGALAAVNRTFGGISRDRRIQVLIIAWLFGNFIEGASGFGAAPALAAPLLAGLGFPVVPALMVSLVCNTLAVPFGAAGTPVLTMNALLVPELAAQSADPAAFAAQMIGKFTTVSAVTGCFLPFLAVAFMILLAGGERRGRSIAEIAPFALFCGIMYVVPWKCTAMLLGPELPSVIGSAAAIPPALLMIRMHWLIPEYVWEFPENRAKGNISANPAEMCDCGDCVLLWKAWLPYICAAVILLLTRLECLPLKRFLISAGTLSIPELFGVPGTACRWPVLMNPGLIPFALISLAAVPLYRLGAGEFFRICGNSVKQVRAAAVAIAASFAMVQIMILSDGFMAPGMLHVIAQAASDSLGKCYILVSPVLGAFGTFFAGSCTLSNILFGSIQFHTAHHLGFSDTLITALQNVGGGLGSMIRISGIVAACATVNASGREGQLLMLNLLPLGVMILLTWIASFFLL